MKWAQLVTRVRSASYLRTLREIGAGNAVVAFHWILFLFVLHSISYIFADPALKLAHHYVIAMNCDASYYTWSPLLACECYSGS